jgi:iron complex transport system permease protein
VSVSGGAASLRFSRKRLLATTSICFGVLVVCAVLAVCFGDQPVSLAKAWENPQSTDGVILLSLRLPRVLLAILVGASLSVSGAAMQALTRNALADPFVLGVSGGAALGATCALALGWDAGASVFAFVGAVAATAFVFLSTARTHSSSTALLTGVIVNALAAALITCVKALTAPDRLGDILHWLAGALGYERASTLLAAAGYQAVALGALGVLSSKLNLLSLGDDEAAALGVSVRSTRRWVLVWSSLSIAGAVSLSGLVGFVGLLVPHILRRWLGPDMRLLIPACALGGGAFLVLADLLARLLFRALHAEPPVGVITALIGGPLFLTLLHRVGKRAALPS